MLREIQGKILAPLGVVVRRPNKIPTMAFLSLCRSHSRRVRSNLGMKRQVLRFRWSPFSLVCMILLSIMRPTQALVVSNHSTSTTTTTTTRVVHLIVLVHGWMGNPQEMGYLQHALERQVHERQQLRATTTTTTTRTTPPPPPKVVVHSATCNRDRTFDGIAAGGTRLADEVNNLIQHYLSFNGDSADTTTTTTVSLSFVGNSLGGLYARHALSQIPFLQSQPPQPTDSDASSCTAPPPPRVRPAVFCTTATPHLGVSQHTYIPLYRWTESLIAHAMQPTGRDLFRFTSVIQDMTVRDEFVQPLLAFEHRVAHANAHQTDFQVPTATASFVSPHSQSRHYIVTDGATGSSTTPSLAVETRPPASQPSSPPGKTNGATLNSTQLADRLDAMGWRKLFWDVRSTLPSLPLPQSRMLGAANRNPLERVVQYGETPRPTGYTSQQVYDHVTASSNQLVLVPLGHTMLVANSKSNLYAWINAAGRPIMEWVAQDLLHRILAVDDDHSHSCAVNTHNDDNTTPKPMTGR